MGDSWEAAYKAALDLLTNTYRLPDERARELAVEAAVRCGPNYDPSRGVSYVWQTVKHVLWEASRKDEKHRHYQLSENQAREEHWDERVEESADLERLIDNADPVLRTAIEARAAGVSMHELPCGLRRAIYSARRTKEHMVDDQLVHRVMDLFAFEQFGGGATGRIGPSQTSPPMDVGHHDFGEGCDGVGVWDAVEIVQRALATFGRGVYTPSLLPKLIGHVHYHGLPAREFRLFSLPTKGLPAEVIGLGIRQSDLCAWAYRRVCRAVAKEIEAFVTQKETKCL